MLQGDELAEVRTKLQALKHEQAEAEKQIQQVLKQARAKKARLLESAEQQAEATEQQAKCVEIRSSG